MFHWIAKTLRISAFTLASVTAPLAAVAAEEFATPHDARFDPSDVFFQGYLSVRAAEKLEAEGHFTAALDKLEHARRLFEAVRRFYPDWKPGMVKGRSEKTEESLAAVQPKAADQRQKEQGAVAELEGGVLSSGREEPAPRANVLEIDPLATRRLNEAEAEVQRLRQQLQQSGAERESESRTASRLRDVQRQRDLLQSQLRTAETHLESLRARLAASPVESEMKSLNQKILGLEQEREAMAMALTQSRGAHTEAMAKIATLEADLNVMRQKQADLDRNLKSEREIASEVVAGQRRQLQELETRLQEKTVELAQAHEQITGLRQELEESRDAFAQLRTERDSLLQERDQMSALLKLNEAGRIQELIEQNVGLAKNLREANERVEALQGDQQTAQDEMTEALRDLAIAKSQINRLHQEKRDQDLRLQEMEAKLRDEETALAQGETSADPAEAEVLRDIIKRQLRMQERRRQARELLLEAVKDLGRDDETIAQAVELFDSGEISLTPEEQRLIADKQVDGEFISPFARDRGTVGRATTELKRELASYDRAATKAFVSGRLLPTRELFQMIIDANPGDVSALCKLGVVQLRLEDPAAAADVFRRAVELDAANPYASRMLGLALTQTGELSAAEECVRRSVSLAPDDAKGHILLALIAYRQGRPTEAESHYRAAIAADPMLSEPYFNLAMICARDKRLDDARHYYHQALERGAVPDASLELRLTQP